MARLFLRSDGRYYAISTPVVDLLGDNIVVTIHGSRDSRRGGVRTYPATAGVVERLAKTRQRHGYIKVNR